MKLLVFSDSHGSSFAMREALARNRGTVDYAVFAGDGAGEFLSLAAEFSDVTFRAVAGNCDFMSSLPLEEEIDACGARILVVHGHKYGVKFSRTQLYLSARVRGFDVVIYGHTHEREEKYYPAEGEFHAVTLFNPGSAKSGDFGVIDVGDGGVLCSQGNVYER